MPSNLEKRIVLFLTLCIGSRLGLVILAKKASPAILWGMGVAAACISVGFMAIFSLSCARPGQRRTEKRFGGTHCGPFTRRPMVCLPIWP